MPTKTEAEMMAPVREAAALALATGFSEDEAVKKTGTASQVIKSWMRTDSTFTHRIREIRGEISQRMVASLTDKMLTAVTALEGLCRDSRNDSTRLAAVKLIMELGMKVQQDVEVEQQTTVHQVSQQQELSVAAPGCPFRLNWNTKPETTNGDDNLVAGYESPLSRGLR